jgi:LuxR family maltose regulon positive regulatory protein
VAVPILATKLYIPPPRPQLILRSRLIQQLNAGLRTNHKLILISAPPGFGKTTLLSEWLYRAMNDEVGMLKEESSPDSIHHSSIILHRSRVAWVSLDEGDNDPVRFWSYVIAALDKAQPGLGTEAMALLQAAQAPPIETILILLINAITDLDRPVILVLDDYHLIETEPIHQTLIFLLDHLPPQLHLVITSRADPPLPLTRLRVRGQLTEVRDSDLRFNLSETATFFNQVMKLNLAVDDIMALEKRTEGWIAGLQLAALSLQGQIDTADFVRAFTGSHRYIFNYLAEEVLARQPRQMQTFLMQTSILDRLHGPLCDAVLSPTVLAESSSAEAANLALLLRPTGSAHADEPVTGQDILEYLEQANLFLIPLDNERRWYRYHHLFGDFLRAHLRQKVDEQEIKNLHHRASRWYAAHNFTTEAISHALAAGDTDQAASLVEQIIIPLLTRGEVATILDWLEALPGEMIRLRPRLCLGRAWVMVITTQWDQVEPLLQNTENVLSAQESTNQSSDDPTARGWWGEIAAMRAMIISGQGDTARAIELWQQAQERLPQDNLVVHSIIAMQLGIAYQYIGEMALARQSLTNAVAMARATDNLIIALSSINNLARVEVEQGRFSEALELRRQALELVDQKAGKSGRPSPLAKWTYLELAEALREQNELEAAKHQLTIALELESPEVKLANTAPIAYIILARILQAQGDEAGADEAIQQARQESPDDVPISPWIDAVRARLWLAQGKLAKAVEWAQNCGLPLVEPFEFDRYPGEYGTLMRIWIAQEQFDEALDLLRRMESTAAAHGRSGRLIEILMLQALAWQAQGQVEQALPPLLRALALGEEGGYIRTFADEGAPMTWLLQQVKSRRLLSDDAFVDKLLAAIGADIRPSSAAAHGTAKGMAEPKILPAVPSSKPSSLPLVEPLSEREMEVLRLVAAGLSNQEIAETLIIAEGTVKKHLHNIFGKLNSRSRTQAILRATELKLL